MCIRDRIGGVRGKGVAGDASLARHVGSYLCGVAVDVGDRNRSTMSGGAEGDGSTVAHWCVLVVSMAGAPAYDKQTTTRESRGQDCS